MDTSIYVRDVFDKYHSKSQIARILTEKWFEEEMYCPNCLKNNLVKNPANNPIQDFICPNCCSQYQLKSQSKPFSSRVLDGEFHKMMDAVKLGVAPHFSFMEYIPKEWRINNLFLIPRFFFSESIIEKRKALSPSARRYGWVGCNILLSRLPVQGRVFVVQNNKPLSKSNVRSNWKKVSFMDKQDFRSKAWTSDVLYCINRLGKQEFGLSEIYEFEDYLSSLHPRNYNVKPKIRQQLQILRDKGLIKFIGKGEYKLV